MSTETEGTPGFNWKVHFERSRVSLILILVIILCIFIIPQEARMGLLGLFTTKTMGVILGILIAHFTRLYKFPYMDLSKMIEDHHWSGVLFLALWYCVIIYCFAMGG